jgi:hypothetical protein
MSIDTLLAEAEQAVPKTFRASTAPLMPVVHTLRLRGFTFDAIYDWFNERGIRVSEARSTFRANVSRRYRKFLVEKSGGIK